MPATWKMWSKEILGYVAPMTYINERYIATIKIERWLANGYSPYEIALIWNGGVPKEKKGVATSATNGQKYTYNSGNYAKKVVNFMKKR